MEEEVRGVRGVRGGRTCGRERTRQRSTCRRFGVAVVGKHQGGGGDWVSQREGDNGRRDGTPGRCGKFSGATPGNWAIQESNDPSIAVIGFPQPDPCRAGPSARARPRERGRRLQSTPQRLSSLVQAFSQGMRPLQRLSSTSDPLQHEKRQAQMSKHSRKNTNPHLQ